MKDNEFDSDKPNVEEGDIAGPLKRLGISHEDHPLSVGTSSPWHQYFEVNLFFLHLSGWF